MRQIILATLLCALTVSVTAAAQTPVPASPPVPTPAPTLEADAPAPGKPAPEKAAAVVNPAGKWKMVVEIESPDRESTVDLKVDGKKVTGTLASTTGNYPAEGEWTDGKLTLSMSYQNVMLVFTGEPKADGTLAGTMDYGRGPIPWKAERVKER